MKSSSPYKKKIAVLRGGPSGEHAVSLKTGLTILQNLDREKFIPIDVYIDRAGRWHVDGMITDSYAALQFVDVVINGLHGDYGENGEVQKILEEAGKPFVGSDSFISHLTMDKNITKLLLSQSGIKVPRHQVVRLHTPNLDKLLVRIWRRYLHPLVLKPIAGGSSLGIEIVTDFVTFDTKVRDFLERGETILVEEFIKGEEVSVAVIEDMRGEELYVPVPIHIRHDQKFFDAEVKKTGAYSCTPMTSFNEKERQRAIDAAKLIYKTLGLRHYARIDFIVTKRGGYFLEVNTLPGLTEHSILPAALRESGIPLKEFFTHLVTLAQKDKKQR
jgi:D-alanine-D-alanine ligase